MEIWIFLLYFADLPHNASSSQKCKFLINGNDDDGTFQCTVETHFANTVKSQFFKL